MSGGFTQADVDAFEARRSARQRGPSAATRLLDAGDAVKIAKGKALAESEIQEAIARYLRGFGHDCNFAVSRMDRPTTGTVGQPDFLGGLRGVGFALEVKRPGGKVTQEQAGQLLRWKLCGFRVAVVHSVAEAVQFIVGQVLPADRGGPARE